jgi:endonuclease YncB( thermonuclease family)
MTTAPTHCPPFGICLPITLAEVRDGDTVVVQIRHTNTLWAIRLKHCWCKELRGGTEASRKLARAAKEYTRQVLEAADHGDLRLCIPFPEVDGGDGLNILSFLTFDRVPGYIYVGPTQTLNRMLVAQGLASTTKDGELGR